MHQKRYIPPDHGGRTCPGGAAMAEEVFGGESVESAPSQKPEGDGRLIEQRLRLHSSGYVAHYPWEWAEDAAPLLAEAAGEIEQLRLTDAEREAIADAADRYASITPESAETVATLRGLLERTQTVGK